MAALRKSDNAAETADGFVDRIASLSRAELTPIALAIDEGEIYPDEALRKLGDIGAWSAHTDLRDTIGGISAIAETCGATAFMAWCQNTLVWYILNSDNAALKAKYLGDAASGKLLGGTGLSNPMKSFFGIEKLKLKGRRTDGGYIVRGALPWVSNLGPDHLFGTIFELEDGSDKVMFLVDCADPNVSLTPCKPFLAMDGTGTYAVQLRDVFIPDDQVLAAPAMPFVKKIRAGFILMQMGMG
ncbi:MAG: acyl-CoA dehydrogenase family protein, partial [Tardiphaga sp.]